MYDQVCNTGRAGPVAVEISKYGDARRGRDERREIQRTKEMELAAQPKHPFYSSYCPSLAAFENLLSRPAN